MPIAVKLSGDGAWPELKDKTLDRASMIHVAILPGGMVSGRPSVAIRMDVPDTEHCIFGECSLREFLAAADAIRARYGHTLG